MRALTWHGKHDVRVDTVPDPEIINPRDAVIEVTATAICGSDLHLYDGVIPGLRAGDILGHEFMGRVVESGPKSTLKKGDRVVVPFTISCGACFFCRQGLFSGCDNSNPVETQEASELLYGHAMSGLFGYSHLTGGYPGGQAEYVRVPFSDVGPIVIPDGVPDEQVLFLSDILPTGWMAAGNCDIGDGDTVAVWGCGPVGLFAIQSALLMGAGQVIAIDHYPGRLDLARRLGARVIDYRQTHVLEALTEMTGGIGPDAVIDAVGMESHGFAPDNLLDAMKQKVGVGADRAHALRMALTAVRKGGRVSVPGGYGGMADKFPLGALMQKGLQIRTGQTHVQKYIRQLLHRILEGEIDTTFLISHRLALEDAPTGYQNFHGRQNEWTKVVMTPGTVRN
ncbi:Threonine dehydrogenase [Paracoccus alcaliphilus]|uniref:Threonine dehydrogenase n=1 Tax=Paracoccus alcaliphilus TaxID=34002 RepID=A0A1H8NTB0_9RHOB|nr:zinc-dependent alcohol dehydrogenase [Paracoccus alcaliphilus]WCR18698.1 glutathione-dependent formaldehyde dehydrogenase [Paracoccus alcaliphilus]SEO32578.1 Threonine dehydrogenase [Paracoccus alcaliphilus]